MTCSRNHQVAVSGVTLAIAMCAWSEASTAQTPSFADFPLPSGSIAAGLVSGPGGVLWFTDPRLGKVGSITTSGCVSEYAVTPPYGGSSLIGHDQAFIVAGPDGALWFTEGDEVGRFSPSQPPALYPMASAFEEPLGIATGPDGALWFAESGAGLGRITTSGVVTKFPLSAVGVAPQNITVGPDKALWFTEYGGNKIGRMTTAGLLTEYSIPTAKATPIGITLGPDGALWFAEFYGLKIGRITTSGALTEFAIPSGGRAQLITTGPDGALWFTEYEGRLGRITVGGAITEFAVPGQPFGSLWDIALGPDGALWYTEGQSINAASNAIGRAILAAGSVISTISPGAVCDTAAAIAPGELITIKGANLGPASGGLFSVDPLSGINSTLAGVEVLFGTTHGTPTFVSGSQVNVIVPWEIASQSSTSVVVKFNGGQSAASTLRVASVAPAIFTLDSTGSGQAAAANLTGSSAGTYNGPSAGVTVGNSVIPTAPASPGSFISLFLTGGGQTNPPSLTSSVNPQNLLLPLMNWAPGSSSVSATIGGQAAVVQFAGAAPTLVTGVVQVNLQVPAGVSGDNLPVLITIDGVQTQSSATVSVH